jgi:hypothetical protein
MTAALYFGIASLEAFLNQQMRLSLQSQKTEEEIFEVLRKGRFLTKLEDWPTQILGAAIPIGAGHMELLKLCNAVRGDLTHQKTNGRDIYARLFDVAPAAVVDAVAQYIVAFHVGQCTVYPYWVFGWNYLNPRPDSHEIILINEQQFCVSLATLGLDVPWGDANRAEAWRDKYMKTQEGYCRIKDALANLGRCEPKVDRFPYQPKLCRRWWTMEHHRTCGHVSKESIQAALRLDNL